MFSNNLENNGELGANRCAKAVLRINVAGNTKDAMSATIEEIPYNVLHKIAARITAEVEGINRVLYDLTPKPVGTIEWE